jgi:hypothetical protein
MYAALALSNYDFKSKLSVFVAMGPVTRLKGTKQKLFTGIARLYD